MVIIIAAFAALLIMSRYPFSSYDEREIYDLIRFEQISSNRIDSISSFLVENGYENGWIWIDEVENLIEAYPKNNYQEAKRFYVIFDDMTAETDVSVMRMVQPGTEGLILEGKGSEYEPDWERIFDNSLSERYDCLQALSELIQQNGSADISTADYSRGETVSKGALRIFAEKLEAAGFLVEHINFQTAILRLVLP